MYVRNVYIASTTGEQKLDYATLRPLHGGRRPEGVPSAKFQFLIPIPREPLQPNLINTVSGTIDGFTLSGGEDASGWGVEVEVAAGDINRKLILRTERPRAAAVMMGRSSRKLPR